MASSLKNIELTKFDDLFKSEEERQADQLEQVLIVPAEQVFPYARQPYAIERPTADLVRLMDSIEKFGIMDPLIVRPREAGGYEIVAGHRWGWIPDLSLFVRTRMRKQTSWWWT